MANTRFRDDFAEIVKNLAYGYVPSDESFRLSATNFDTAGATSLLTTVEDLLAWHTNFDTSEPPWPTVGRPRYRPCVMPRAYSSDVPSLSTH